MALTDKYQALIDIANQNGVENFSATEQDGVLYISGTAPNGSVKQRMWDKYQEIDPEMRGGDLVMNIEVSGGEYEEYEVRSGDSLSKIASHHGTTWKEIWDVNRDQISDPNKIYPGQKLRIPRG